MPSFLSAMSGTAQSEETTCNFYFILAAKLRDASEVEFPQMLRLQDMLATHADWVEKKSIRFEQACHGAYSKEYLAVSQRWEDLKHPDPTGAQLSPLRRYLKENPQIKYVWYDFMSMSQGDRMQQEKAEFGLMLTNLDMLFIGCHVLILLDRSCERAPAQTQQLRSRPDPQCLCPCLCRLFSLLDVLPDMAGDDDRDLERPRSCARVKALHDRLHAWYAKRARSGTSG